VAAAVAPAGKPHVTVHVIRRYNLAYTARQSDTVEDLDYDGNSPEPGEMGTRTVEVQQVVAAVGTENEILNTDHGQMAGYCIVASYDMASYVALALAQQQLDTLEMVHASYMLD